jgi:ubiquitin-like 1-activating enzyme E1 B
MAGNIIPAIASTNAIVAGLIVTTAFNVLMGQYHKCHTIYVSNRVTARKELFAVDKIVAPNPKCYVCAEKPEIALKVDVSKMTVRTLGERVLKKELNMVAPDVEIDDGQGTILISSEEGETDDIADKFLQEFKIKEGTRLKCDDFLQNYNLNITIYEMKTDENDRDKAGELFEIVGDRSKLVPTEMKETPVSATNGNGSAAQPGPSKPSTEKYTTFIEDDDDLQIIDEVEPMNISPEKSNAAPSKRPAPGAHTIVLPAKKRKVQFNNQEEDTTPVPVSSIPVVDLE